MTASSPSAPENPKPVAFPITVGVTGHRRLNDTEKLREAIGRVLARVSGRYRDPGSAEIRFCVLTPLAEGADCIVAEEILSSGKYRSPFMKVILPLAVEDYRRDFGSPDARERFERLMKKARVTLTLRRNSISDDGFDAASSPDALQKVRRQAYEDVGRFVVDHCDVLIAIWDGKPAKGAGGTADTVAYARKTRCPVYAIDPHCPSAFRFIGAADEDRMHRRLDRCHGAVDEFNRRLAARRDDRPYVRNMYRRMFQAPPEGVDSAISRETRTAVRNHLMPYYAMTSVTAKRYRNIYRCVGLTAFWLAFAAVATIGVGAIFFHSGPLFFAIELCLLMVIIAMIHYADRVIRSHKQWMQYRFLTESIRSAIFLACCGKTLQPFHPPRRSGGDDNQDVWMAMVFEEICRAVPEAGGITEQNFECLGEFLRQRWVDDQLDFHRRTSRKNQQLSRALETTGRYILFAAIAAAVVHLMLPVFGGVSHGGSIAGGLTLAALVLPALAATIEAIRSHREYKRLAMRSARISFELERIKSRMKVLSPARLDRIVDDITALMQSETGEWLTMMELAELRAAV